MRRCRDRTEAALFQAIPEVHRVPPADDRGGERPAQREAPLHLPEVLISTPEVT